MQFEKKSVRLGDIRPSGQNPREDFGDIGALARSIEATGGEPLNPPVVVADGNVYRIVDGERRYRALSSLYGEDREVSALVADTMDEANELVAMLATDDKRRLTEAERARGVQQMLVLGVDEQRIERASRATAGQIRAARRLRGRIGAGVQVMPGVTIGSNVVIGGGSIVTRDIPSNSVAVGNPCRVIRQITDDDRRKSWDR